jgi:hypothetical protein
MCVGTPLAQQIFDGRVVLVHCANCITGRRRIKVQVFLIICLLMYLSPHVRETPLLRFCIVFFNLPSCYVLALVTASNA